MLKWCAYCQEFQGEVPPFDDLVSTHGMCGRCSIKALDLNDAELAHARKLKAIQAQLMAAARSEDLAAAGRFVQEAITAQVRPMDILMGLVAPLLYQAGEDWKNAVIGVAEEHRITGLCEKIFELVEAALNVGLPAGTQGRPVEAVLVNAMGNFHTLALRFLAFWLVSRGITAQPLYPGFTQEGLAEVVKKSRPKVLLVSIALAEQRPGAVQIVELIAGLEGFPPPKIIIGGHAVKCGMIAPIRGAELMANFASLAAFFES